MQPQYDQNAIRALEDRLADMEQKHEDMARKLREMGQMVEWLQSGAILVGMVCFLFFWNWWDGLLYVLFLLGEIVHVLFLLVGTLVLKLFGYE